MRGKLSLLIFFRFFVRFFFFLFGNGFLCRDFTDQREIWHEASFRVTNILGKPSEISGMITLETAKLWRRT